MSTTTYRRYPTDGVVDVNHLPDQPWSQDHLGVELFSAMASACGAGVSGSAVNPSLDARSWAISRAHRIIADQGLSGDDATVVLAEGEQLQAEIDATLPDSSGTPRAPGAPPLTGSTTTRKAGRRYF